MMTGKTIAKVSILSFPYTRRGWGKGFDGTGNGVVDRWSVTPLCITTVYVHSVSPYLILGKGR